MIKVVYTSPATPQYPYDVRTGVIYECKKNKNKYIIKGLNFEREFPLNFIKNMFTPIDGYSWDMLNPTSTNKKDKVNNIKE